MTLASQEGYRRQAALQGHAGGAVGPMVLMCVQMCVCVKHTGSGCPVKFNGACQVPNDPELAAGLTHSDLPLRSSLSLLGCQRMAVNLNLP